MEVLRLLGALAAIVFIFYLAWLVPRVIAKRDHLGHLSGRHLRVMEKVPLGKDTFLVLVKAADRLMLLGVTPGGITHLGDMDPALAEPAEPPPDARPFSEIFREAVSESLPRGRMRDSFDRIIGRKAKDGEKTERPGR